MACTEPQCLYSTAIPLLPLWAIRTAQNLSACTVHLYHHYHYEPYGLHRTSVPVKCSCTSTPAMDRTAFTESQCLYSTAIHLLHLCALRAAQNLSACTVQLYLYPPMGSTASTELQCLYSTAIPLLPLCAVRPAQNLSACTVQLYIYSPHGPYGQYRTSVHVQYSYTSTPLWAVRTLQSLSPCTAIYNTTPHMGGTDFKVPHCMYSTAKALLILWSVRPVKSLSGCTLQL